MFKDLGNSIPLGIYEDFTKYLEKLDDALYASDFFVDNNNGEFDACFIKQISFRGFHFELDEETCLWEKA
tara:strand:- start:1534 stop:1743 length:210 start_codon:yes stop_codon:yes gene_type:complete